MTSRSRSSPRGRAPTSSPAVNKALAELKADGTLKAISEKYFQTDVSVKQ